MRVLIVKLSSMGDVIHALPVVSDLRNAFPGVLIDWAVEPAFAPLVRDCEGVAKVIDVPLRRWTRTLGSLATWREMAQCRRVLRAERYDAVLDLQGLSKSALVAFFARGTRYALANRTDGSSYEAPTRWLAHHAVRVARHSHALDRSREMAAAALGYRAQGAPNFGLRHHADTSGGRTRTVALLHGASRDDKLWPEDRWIALGRILSDTGLELALPQGSDAEGARAARIAAAIGPSARVWPRMSLEPLEHALADCQGAIGVDSGLSHLAVALDLPHVQLYNVDTAWRTGPRVEHGHRHQLSLVAKGGPSLADVVSAWSRVMAASVASSLDPLAPTDKGHAAVPSFASSASIADDPNPAPTATAAGHASRARST